MFILDIVPEHKVCRWSRGMDTSGWTNLLSLLPLDSLKALVSTLLARLPEDTSPKIMIVKPEIPAPTPIRPNGQKTKQVGLAYDPSMLFVLEFATRLSTRDEETVAALGKDLSEALMGVVRDASGVHPVTLSRAVYYLLSFVRASHVSFLPHPRGEMLTAVES